MRRVTEEQQVVHGLVGGGAVVDVDARIGGRLAAGGDDVHAHQLQAAAFRLGHLEADDHYCVDLAPSR